jgi:hypothetical protein
MPASAKLPTHPHHVRQEVWAEAERMQALALLQSVTSLDMVSERGKGKGKVGQRSSSRNAGQAAEIVVPDVVPTSAA